MHILDNMHLASHSHCQGLTQKAVYKSKHYKYTPTKPVAYMFGKQQEWPMGTAGRVLSGSSSPCLLSPY